MRTIFMGGIHGAGKSHLCRRLGREFELTHYSAGDLRSVQQTGRSDEGEDAGISLEQNQLAIIQRLKGLTEPDERVILDGHFALVTGEGEVIPVPVRYFHMLCPIILLVLDTPVDKAQGQLKDRDDLVCPTDLLRRLRSCELSNAHLVSQSLTVPLRIVRGPNSFGEVRKILQSALSDCE